MAGDINKSHQCVTRAKKCRRRRITDPRVASMLSRSIGDCGRLVGDEARGEVESADAICIAPR
jgi:hypothetical protein